MRVVVVGAGIGGSVLAHALRRLGADVRLHDRDPAAASTGGYRLALDGGACAALRRWLPAPLFHAVLASSAGPHAYRRFAFADHRMRLLGADPVDRASENVLIGRVPLRVLLTSGLDGAVRWGSEFTRHETHADGTVTAHFADGHAETADLLVGADGVGSRVAAALAGRATSAPVGVRGIAGRTPLTGVTRPLVPAILAPGPALAFGPGGTGAFLAVHDPGAGAAVDPATCRDVAAVTEAPALVWGVLAADHRHPPGARALDGSALVEAAASLLAGWSAATRRLVAAADPASAAFFRFSACDPDADLTPWPAGAVTALGDAVHAMPPTGGRAAATAIRDADVLADELAAALRGESTIALAVHAFHRRMAAYAPAAVRESLAPLRWQRLFAGRAGTSAARVVLPAWAGARRLVARGA